MKLERYRRELGVLGCVSIIAAVILNSPDFFVLGMSLVMLFLWLSVKKSWTD